MNSKLKKDITFDGIGMMLDGLLIFFGFWGSFLEIYHYTFGMLTYYTTLSNLFVAIASVFHLIYKLQKFRGKTYGWWMPYIKYLAVCCMTITFLIVLFVLAPISGEYYKYLWEGPLKYQHTICPFLAILSFVCFDSREIQISRKMMYASMLPTVAYAVFSVTGNVLRLLHGPYPFLYVYQQPVYLSVFWCVLILGIAYLTGWGLYGINNKVYKRRIV